MPTPLVSVRDMAKIVHDEHGYHTRLSLTDSLTGRRVQRRVSAKTKRALDAEVARIRAEWNSGSYIEPDKTTVAQWCETWFKTYKASPVSRYKRGLIIKQRIAGDDIGKIPLVRLRYSHVQDWVDRLVMEGLAPNTVRSIVTTLSIPLSQAVRRQLIASNPCADLDLPSPGAPRWIVLEEEQARRLVTDTRDDPLHAAWVLLVTVGLRRGELLALDWRDVDLTAGTLHIGRTLTLSERGRRQISDSGKTASATRTIRLPQVCLDALRRHRARQNARRLAAGDAWVDSGALFDSGLGERVTSNGLYAAFEHVRDACALPAAFRMHDTRHTAISHMLRAGVPAVTVAAIAGHANAGVTLSRYAHIVKGMHDDAAGIIDRLYLTDDERRSQLS